MTTMAPGVTIKLFLSAQLLKEIAFKKHKEAVTKGVKDNYIQEDSVSSLFLLLFVIFCTPGTLKQKPILLPQNKLSKEF